MFQIKEWSRPDDFNLDELNLLMQQLCTTCDPLATEKLEFLLQAPGSKLFVALNENQQIIGTVSLGIYQIPTTLRCWIEDIVVDEKYRGQQLGEQLVLHAISVARDLGAHYIDLTSRPERVAANKLYQKMGFERRITNVYRKKITD